MNSIPSSQFDEHWKSIAKYAASGGFTAVETTVREIIEAVRSEGDAALRRYASRFDKSSPEKLEVPYSAAEAALEKLLKSDKAIAGAMELAARNLFRFAELQRNQFSGFETETAEGLFTGQKVIPVERAAVYVPAGRFPLFSSVMMGMIPAIAAGVDEIILASPPMEDGLPDKNILAAAALSMAAGAKHSGVPRCRIFAMGGAQAIAALALGTESVPKASVIVGPGNKYVAEAKRALYGEVGIDLIAGPTDVLVVVEEAALTERGVELVAADMLAQAEHDADARARALVSSETLAKKIRAALERRLAALPEASRKTAAASLESGGLIIVYETKAEAIRIANIIAPEHLELHAADPDSWISAANAPYLRNYGSLFSGALAAEVLGDYSAGINHTLPTSGSARFTGGLSVRHFLKTPTTLRCANTRGFEEARAAAEILGRAEGLFGHSFAAKERRES